MRKLYHRCGAGARRQSEKGLGPTGLINAHRPIIRLEMLAL